MSIIHACGPEVSQPSVELLCMSESWFGCHSLEKCCWPERDPCSGEASCLEMLAQMKGARTEAALAMARNGTVQSQARSDRSVTYRGVKQIKEHMGWIDNEIDKLERQCGSKQNTCVCIGPCGCRTVAFNNNPSSIGFTRGRW